MASITINNKTIECQKYQFAKYEIDLNSGRNLDGVMDRNVLAHHPRKLFVTFPPKDENAMAELLNLIDNPELNVTAYNPWTKTNVTMDMMHGDLIPEIYWDGVDPATDEKEVLYNAFSIELVEY